MVDDRRREATRIHGNVTSGGRYGDAEDKMHMEPEVAPLGIEDADVQLPPAIPGALPENAEDREGEIDVPREKAVVRLPEATAEALTEEE